MARAADGRGRPINARSGHVREIAMSLVIDGSPTAQNQAGVAQPAAAAHDPAPAAASAQGDLVGVVVHELRQPLTVIRGQLELGRRQIGIDETRVRAAIDLAITQVDRMAKLLNALLDAHAAATTNLECTVVRLDLRPLVAQAIARHEDGLAHPISFRSPDHPVRVRGDADRIDEILDNLLSNARKYSPAEAPIEVSLTLWGAVARVRVADHGTGVPSSEQTQLFTPFYRASNSRDIPGTGLGLHISKQLAERQGGQLWLEASSAAGSVFTLDLPAAVDRTALLSR
jgi:two-component system, OmpR family, sensor histidine kinase VicK